MGGIFGTYSFIRMKFYRALGVSLGKNTWISYFTYIEQPADAKEPLFELQENSTLGFHNSILTVDRKPLTQGKPAQYKKVTIEKNVFMGANVTVLPGCTIGQGSVIGAGSIVTTDIPPYHIAVGAPARSVRKIQNPQLL